MYGSDGRFHYAQWDWYNIKELFEQLLFTLTCLYHKH